MKAVRYHRYGGSDVLEYEEAPRPVPGPLQVLVKVAATSFNPVDAGIRGGYLSEVYAISFPHVPGIDVAGTIAELGERVQGWNVGDAVVAMLPLDADGAAADYALAPAEALAAAPSSVALADTAALPEAGLTAWQSLFEIAGLTGGQTVLINGASGAVGGYAVQLAKQAGAVVTATATARDAERLRGLGADRIVDYIDYTQSPVVVEGAPFDVVLNLISTTPEQTEALIGVIADGGFHVGTMTAGARQRRASGPHAARLRSQRRRPTRRAGQPRRRRTTAHRGRRPPPTRPSPGRARRLRRRAPARQDHSGPHSPVTVPHNDIHPPPRRIGCRP